MFVNLDQLWGQCVASVEVPYRDTHRIDASEMSKSKSREMKKKTT